MDINNLLDSRVGFGQGSIFQILYICMLFCLCSCCLTSNGITITAMRNGGQLDEGQAALVETMLSLGAVIGALTYSWLSLKVGRLRLLNLTAVAVLVLNYLTGITDDFYYFLGIRTLQSVLIQNIQISGQPCVSEYCL